MTQTKEAKMGKQDRVGQVEWQIQDGRTVIVEARLELSKSVYLDGPRDTVDCCDLYVVARLGDMTLGYGEPQMMESKIVNGIAVVARIGNLAMTADRLEAVRKMIAAVIDCDEWTAKQERIAKNKIEAKAYEAHCAMMRKAMRE